MANMHETLTNLRTKDGRVYTFKWQSPVGMTAKEATAALTAANLGDKIASALGISTNGMTFAVTSGTHLSEGVIRQASDKTAPRANKSASKTAPVDPEARARELAVSMVAPAAMEAALKRARIQVAREAVEAQVAEYDREVAELQARIAELGTLKAQALTALKAARGK